MVWIDQWLVREGTVKCTDSVTLIEVLHAPLIFINLLTISAIICKQKYIVNFDISKMVFQEKGTSRILGTEIWNDGLWYLDKKEMDTTLATMVDRVRAKGSGVSIENELILIHRRIGHFSFSLLEHLYPLKYEKADKEKFVCDGCEFEKNTRSSYVSSGSESSHTFDLVYSDV
jgi:GAG-pre-integrase domain